MAAFPPVICRVCGKPFKNNTCLAWHCKESANDGKHDTKWAEAYHNQYPEYTEIYKDSSGVRSIDHVKPVVQKQNIAQADLGKKIDEILQIQKDIYNLLAEFIKTKDKPAEGGA